MDLGELRSAIAVEQKKGLHFILTSVLIWSAILIVHLTGLPILTKNLLTFFAVAPLVPIAYLISRLIDVDFSGKGNPLTSLGLLFSMNQFLYLLIAMWVYPTVPEKLVMVMAMIFGAHLLPFGWLYLSKSYTVMSVVITLAALLVGVNFAPYAVAGLMVVLELSFCVLLWTEVSRLPARSVGAH